MVLRPLSGHERPECLGLVGFVLGHRYPARWSFTREVFEQAPYCTRCGLAAQGVPEKETRR